VRGRGRGARRDTVATRMDGREGDQGVRREGDRSDNNRKRTREDAGTEIGARRARRTAETGDNA
jgi:hypothetical protein